jgi:hypothetical protein
MIAARIVGPFLRKKINRIMELELEGHLLWSIRILPKSIMFLNG